MVPKVQLETNAELFQSLSREKKLLFDERNFNLSVIILYFKTQMGPVSKNTTTGPPAGKLTLDPFESKAVICQPSYDGRCQELGNQFCIYCAGDADEKMI